MSNNQVKSENDTRKIFTTLVLVLTLMICTTSATYAYFALSAISNNVITGNAATASLTLTVTPATLKSSNTGVMVPQLETALETAMNGTNQCVDGNGNIVCKVYTVTVTNGSTAAVKLNGTISFTGTNTSMINLKWKRVNGATTLGTNTNGSYSSDNTSVCTLNAGSSACASFPTYDLISGSSCSTTTVGSCSDVSLSKTGVSGNSQTYYFVFWINETGDIQTDSGTWKAIITFTGEDGKGITSTITS